jgi:hypothetical protein
MIRRVFELKPALIAYTQELDIFKDPYNREIAINDYFSLEE